jgi:hypothetical protein
VSKDTFVRGVAGELTLPTTLLDIDSGDLLTGGSTTHFTIPHWKESCSVPLGIFPKIPRPEFEFYTSRKMEWLPSLEGVKSFDMAPTATLAGREDGSGSL